MTTSALAAGRALVALTALLTLASLATPAIAYPERKLPDREFPAPGGGDFVLADLTGDGYTDLAAVDDVNSVLWIYRGSALGIPQRPQIDVPQVGIVDLAVGDLDGDGQSELLAVDGQRVLRLPGRGSDPWTPIVEVEAPGARKLATGDFNDDGHTDIAILGPTGASVWFQQGATGGFDANAYVALSDGARFDDLAAGDVNGDGQDDLTLVRPFEVRVHLQGDQGLDPAPVQLAAKGIGGETSVALVDVAGDAPLLLAASAGDPTADATVGLWRWDGQWFHLGETLTGPYAARLTVGDANDDRRTDLALVGLDGSVAVFLRGTVSFGAPVPNWVLGGNPASDVRVAIGDVNGDGFDDVLARSHAPDTFLVYLQEDAPPALIRAIPSTYAVNRATLVKGAIDLRQFFVDDHNRLTFSLVYGSDPWLLKATVDRNTLDLEAANRYGNAEFRVSAWDGNPSHAALQSNLFTVLVNDVPTITGTPPLRAVAGERYAYVVSFLDAYPTGDLHTFALRQGPEGMTIDAATGLMTWTPAASDVGPHTVLVQVRDRTGGVSVQQFVVVVAPGEVAGPLPFVVLGVAAETAGLLAAAALLNENAKFAFLLFVLPLYTKIKRERILDHFVRGQIFGYIQANPGEHYNAIKHALGLTNGSLAHHLRTLEREHFLKSKRYGLYRRFYPMNMRLPADDAFAPNEVQRTILETVRTQPGITQKDIARRLGLTPPTVNYHVGVLSERNLIRVVRLGRSTHCTVVEGRLT